MISRRSFIYSSTTSLLTLSLGSLFACQKKNPEAIYLPQNWLDYIGPLLSADENGIMLPDGFSSREVARSGLPPHADSSYLWHRAPDGGATFSTDDDGWIYVSNSEVSGFSGGAGAIRFDSSGNIIQAYSILDNTSRNCAGGATPWKTWLSCEEIEKGMVWECDPYGQLSAVPRPALGRFAHEAVAVDVDNNHLYMTEDRRDGCLYRFSPDSINSDGFPDLSAGTLEVAVVDPATLICSWLPVPDPTASSRATRYQVGSSTKFKGGEGVVSYRDVVSFATKGDDRVWSYSTETNRISIVYDAGVHPNAILTGVDNIVLSQSGDLLVAEDGDNMQIVAIANSGKLVPLVQLVGHDASEVTGPAFSPDGTRLYFSSQRGTTGKSRGGITYEVTGPFHRDTH